MAHLILTGATGLVGSAVLVNLLSRPASEVSKVTIISRREVPLVRDNPRFETIVQKDFGAYDAASLQKLQGASGAIWAQGISTSQVSRDEYVKITVDYPIAAAKTFSKLSDSFKFVYVSGMGATTSPSAFTPFYGRIKGQTEQQLLDLMKVHPQLKPYSARPAFVDAAGHQEIQELLRDRKPSIVEKLLIPVAGPVFRMMPSQMSPTAELGKVLVDLALGDGAEISGAEVEQGRLLPNSTMRRLRREGVAK